MRAAFSLTLLSLSLGAVYLRSGAQLSVVVAPIHRSVRHSDVSSGTIARALAIVTAPLGSGDKSDLRILTEGLITGISSNLGTCRAYILMPENFRVRG